MPRKLPIEPKNALLPFQDPSFHYGDFEGFFADFLRLHPVITISREGAEFTGRISNAWRYETSGDSQNGIDIRAEVQVTGPEGCKSEETWVFQCKHRARWSEKQTREAIELADKKFPDAAFRFLLVTCELGAKAVDEGRAHAGWQLWSGAIITSHLRSLSNRDEAAKLVNTYFGPHWAEAILGLSGTSPFQAVGAFFSRQMEKRSFHHHKAAVVGRDSELDALGEFLRDSDHRVLILPGAGGSGKSRLLMAFAQSLSPSQRRKWSIRFYDDIGTPPTAVDVVAIEGSALVVIDDAHRQNVEPLLRLLIRSEKTKIILSTRPQGIPVVRSSASAAGIDARCINELPALRKLTATETKQVVESLLGNEFKDLAYQVVAQSRDCLLIAVVACEMILQGHLTKSHLASHQDFEQAVFVRLIDESVARLGLITARERIDQMLDIIALAGPLPREGPWFDLLCQWTDPAAKPHQARTWLDDLKRCGLLTEKAEGYRITPDLLSDYLLFRATFDSAHRDKGFAADFIARVPEGARDEALARCLPNLAEAEWRARCESEGRQESVIEPLLDQWTTQFRSASFRRRREMLGHWSRFGVYLPEQTLRIVALARELTTSTAPNEDGMFGISRDSHEDVVESCIPLLKEVARYHLDHMHDCLDLLWSIGCNEPKRWMHNNQGHPLSAIIDVAQLEYRKPISVNEHALAWIEQQFVKPEIVERLHEPVWWFVALLAPFLKHSVEDQSYEAATGIFSLQHIPVDAKRVGMLRERVLALVSTLADQGKEGVALNAIKVLGDGVRMINMPGLKDDDKLQKKWVPLRRDALDRLAKVAQRYKSGFIHWAIWQELWWHICYEPTELLRAECWRVFEMLEDSFELRLVRATCSTGESEITRFHNPRSPVRKQEHSWKVSRELWTKVCEKVANELANRYSDARTLHDSLAEFVKRGAQLGFHPGLGTVLLPLTSHSPDLADALATAILTTSRQEVQHAFGSLVDGLSPSGKPVRLDLVCAAAESSSQALQIEASRLLIWWHRHQRLPKEGKTLLLRLIASGSPALLRSALQQFSLLPDEQDLFAEQLLASVLENPTTEDITEPLLAMLDRLEHKNSAVLPPDLVASLLSRLVPVPRIHQAMAQYHLNHLAETHPKEVFGFYRQRVEYSRGEPKLDPFNSETYEALPSHGDHVSLHCFAATDDFGVEFTKLRDELITEMQKQSDAGDHRRIFEHGGYHWQLRQLARWMLEESGARYAELAVSWIPMIDTLDDLWLFLDVVVGDSPSLVLGHPSVLGQLIHHVAARLPQHLSKMRDDLMFSASRWVGASRNPRWRKVGDTSPAEEEEPWHIIPRVEKQINDLVHLPLLKLFYEELLVKCKAMLAYHKRADENWPNTDDEY
jgi:hypothetical protein